MISFKSHLGEAFNTKIQWKQTSTRPETEKYLGRIGKQFVEMIYNWSQAKNIPEKSDVNIVFSVGGDMSVTGKGDQMQIFGAVINHIKEFIEKNPQIRVASFTASKSAEDGETGSRNKLYSKLVKRFATKMGFKIEELDLDELSLYLLTRKAK